mgnify:CR=1 FL=1
MKTKKLRIIKMCLIAVAVVFPISICILPSFNALQTNFLDMGRLCGLSVIYDFFHEYVSGT